jgi:hypothetical protein
VECVRVFLGKPEVNGPLVTPRHRLEDNIEIDFRDIGLGDVDWIHLAQDWYQ